MRLNKNIKIFLNYFLGPILFLWLSWSIYKQIRQQPDLSSSWLEIRRSLGSVRIFNLVAVLLLMLVNWGIEAYKWQLSVAHIQPVGFARAYKAILSGVSFSVSTPNRVGEYIGRVLYMDEGNRLRAVSLTIVSSMSQLMITLLFGICGLVALRNKLIPAIHISNIQVSWWLDVLLYVTIFILIILTLLYFRLSLVIRLFPKLSFTRPYIYMVNVLEDIHATLLIKLLSLSAARYLVFVLQYFLLFTLFGVHISWWDAVFSVSVIFLVLAVIPSFAIAELGMRGEISWQVLKVFSTNIFGIFWTTCTIWLINLILPAIAGSLLIVGIKIFKNRNERNQNSGVS